MLEDIYEYPKELIYADKYDIDDYTTRSKEPIDKLLADIYAAAVKAGFHRCADPVKIFNSVYRYAIIMANTHNILLLPEKPDLYKKIEEEFPDDQTRLVMMMMLKAMVYSQKDFDIDQWAHIVPDFDFYEMEFEGETITTTADMDVYMYRMTYNDILEAMTPIVEKAIEDKEYHTDLRLRPTSPDMVCDETKYWIDGSAQASESDLFYILGSYDNKKDRDAFWELAQGNYGGDPEFMKIGQKLDDGTFDAWWSDMFGIKSSYVPESEEHEIDEEETLSPTEESGDSIPVSCIAGRFKKMLKYASHDKVCNIFDEMNTLMGGDKVWESHKDEIVEILATHKESANTMSVGENHGIMAGSINMKMSPENEAKLLEDIKNKNKQI